MGCTGCYWFFLVTRRVARGGPARHCCPCPCCRNAHCASTLPPVLLNFSRKVKTPGFFAPERWENGRARSHEISLSARHLTDRPPSEVAATLVHEMCHLWQLVYGEPSRPGYHNAQWAAKMEEVGLVPSDTGQPGGNRTGQHMAHDIAADGRFWHAFQQLSPDASLPWQCRPASADPRTLPTSGSDSLGPPRSKVKYSCPISHGNVWGKPALSLICGLCGEFYVPRPT